MSKLNIYKLFLKFIGGNSIEIKGLYLKPKRILKDVLTIEFSIENPNEISYYIDVVGDYLNFFGVNHDFQIVHWILLR